MKRLLVLAALCLPTNALSQTPPTGLFGVDLTANNAQSVSAAGHLRLRYNSSTSALEESVAGAAYVAIAGPNFSCASLNAFPGADLGARLSNAIAGLPTTGGCINAQGYTGAQIISSTITIDRPVTIYLGAAQIVSTATPAFSVVASTAPLQAANFRLEGLDQYSTTITAANNGTIILMSGNFFGALGIGAQALTVRNLGVFGNVSDNSVFLNTQSFPTTNFESGTITIEHCLVENFGNIAIQIGTSVYFTRIHDNEILSNNGGVSIAGNAEASIWKNQFYQAVGSTNPTVTLNTLMTVVDHNYFYRSTITDTSTAPDILLQPQAALPSQAGGYDWIINNRFGSEHENFDPARYRIRLLGTSTSTVGGPMVITGNRFLGPSSGATCSASGTTTMNVALSAGHTTQGIVAGSTSMTVVAATNANFNGNWIVASVVDSLNFTVTLTSSVTASGSCAAFNTNSTAIRQDNPHLQWWVEGNFFVNYGVMDDDEEATPASPLSYGQSIWKDNSVDQTFPGYKIFTNGGKEFTVVGANLDAGDLVIDGNPKPTETPSLQNRVYRTEALNLWAKNSGISTTTGQTDPYGTTRATLLTLTGTTPSSQSISQTIDTTGMTNGQRFCVKFWAKAGTLSTVAVVVRDTTAGTDQGDYKQFSLTSSWKQYQFWTSAENSADNFSLTFFPGDSSFVNGTVFVFAPQVSDLNSDYYPNSSGVAVASDTTAGASFQQAIVLSQITASSLATAITMSGQVVDATSGFRGPSLVGESGGALTITGNATSSWTTSAGSLSVTGNSGLTIGGGSGTLQMQLGGVNHLVLASSDTLTWAQSTGNKLFIVQAAAATVAGVQFTIQGPAGGAGNATPTAPGAGGNVSLVAGAAGADGGSGLNANGGTISINGGAKTNAGTDGAVNIANTRGNVLIGNATQTVNNTINSGTASFSLSYGAASSGAHNLFIFTMPTDTGQTASTEISSGNFNSSATRTWATGNFATQREWVFRAPTYAFAAASTITTAATVDITGPPIQGTNATLTNTYAFRMEAGAFNMGGTTQANLGTPANGTFIYCSDCTIANPCAAGGNGAFAKRLNGVWVCN